jgi:hypothetical protein
MTSRLSVTALVLSTLIAGVTLPTHGNCKKASRNQECLGCANISVEMENAKSGTNVGGTVYDQDLENPLAGVLVEVFPQPEGADSLSRFNLRQENRLKACFVGKDGKFALHLKAGTYELRFSIQPGWNCTYQRIDVVKNSRSEDLRIRMSLGT